MRRNTILCLLVLVLAGCGFSTSAEPEIVSTQLLIAASTNTPAPVETEEVAGEGGEDSTPAPAQTEEATDAVPTVAADAMPETIRVTGEIRNPNGSAPENVSVKVLSFTFDAQGQPDELLDEQDITSVGSTYTLEALKVQPSAFVVAQLEYLGVTYTSELTEASRLVDGTLSLPIEVNELTSDTSVMSISAAWYIFGASPDEGIAEIFNWYFIKNTSDRVLYGENGAFSLELPRGVTNIQITSDTTPDRYIINTDGEAPVIIDTNPLRPGEEEILSITYYTPYTTSATFTQTIKYPTVNTSIYLSRNFDFALEADGFTDGGVVPLRGLGDYRKFDRTEVFNPGDVLDFTISGTRPLATQVPAAVTGTNTPLTTDEDSFLEDNSQAVLIVGIVIVLLGFMMLFWDLQKSRMRLALEMSRLQSDLPQTQDHLITAIAELDEAFEQGKIPEKEYEVKREALKEQLRRLM